MESRRNLPPDGGGNPKRSASTECETDEGALRRDQRDPETSTHRRVRKEDLCDVPRKVPRFQYVDFPSLHQCIQQLSVPPLNGWLAKTPNYRPASPQEKVPKFKYVDYPSLHHCIQQLSVPPLESWSAGLLRFNEEARLSTSQAGPGRKNLKKEGGELNTQERGKGTGFVFPRDSSVSGWKEKTLRDSASETPQKVVATETECGLQSNFSYRSESGSCSGEVLRTNRPSVISLVQTDKQRLWTKADHLEEQLTSGDAVGRVVWNILPESVCPFCQQMFTNPEQFRAHQRSHRDKKKYWPHRNRSRKWAHSRVNASS
ncbi:hypothetical protein DNTS_032208, partial [Danionella cerebrum]